MKPSTTAKAAATFALFLSANTIVTAQDGFRRIATDFGDSKPTGVVLPSICIGSFLVPKAMYTFEPAAEGQTDVTILTNPQDLVEPGYDPETGLIYFKFIQDVSELATDAGVLIKFPADQLETVNVCCSQSAQIKNGFTNFQSLIASTSASVNASFNVAQSSDLTIGALSSAEVNVKVTRGANKIDVYAEGDANLGINGDVTSLGCDDGSTCKITGTIADPKESKITGGSSAKNVNCEGITLGTGSTCQTKSPNVRVSTSQPLFFSGVKEECFGGEDLNGLGGPAIMTTEPPSVSSVPTLSPAPSLRPSKIIKTIKPTPQPTQPPVTQPPSGAFSNQGVSLTSIAISGAAVLLLLLGQ
eukprot:CAMPEP_0201187938 /NCGR_PEP_ID=MMETSP0851-20130426/134400_1 /ASSEMBLY_ACC=CAM_ASM_000631 /TAXON_ID=183588 /ORGANISM="Pseudo-nitzschia fraudulenta, Strain WWA7" /LENGTH=357 /DNA_ID=CAMNT_0047473485 /DNA_START=117 /DNA_END=1190 /DNA_ORIENTATION=+